ncbi:helix-turn-helix transcriptional regulator [Kitasatospora cineracea]|uniref:helix-turn-helix transcriptional regulator n=1 Tax=Kitasatospora cineracea TaxID=88074 RepID=UPI003795EC4B
MTRRPGVFRRPGAAAHRAAVEHALATGTVLRLHYADAAGRSSERLVEPAGLLTAGGHWYLIAWCRTRRTRRTRRAGRGFRLDRITGADPTPEPAGPHDLAALLRGSAAAGARPPAALGALGALDALDGHWGELTERQMRGVEADLRTCRT